MQHDLQVDRWVSADEKVEGNHKTVSSTIERNSAGSQQNCIHFSAGLQQVLVKGFINMLTKTFGGKKNDAQFDFESDGFSASATSQA